MSDHAEFELMNHQKEGLEIARTHAFYGFWDDMGVGKTVMMIAIRQALQKKTLVVCPLGVIETAWIDDIKKFFPSLLPYTINLWELWKKRKNKGGEFKYNRELKRCDLALVNYEGFKNQLERIWNAGFKMVILDESWKIASPKSTISKIMIKYCDTIKFVYPMCGTPAPNSQLEYFNQFRVMSEDIFGNSYYGFRNKFFSPDYMGYKWNLKKHMTEEFHKTLAKYSRSVFRSDVLDLPEITYNVHEVTLDAAETKAHKEMKNDLATEFKNVEFWAATDAVKGMKLRQITGGFLKQKGKVIQIGKSKIRALDELLGEIGNHQVIVWIQFHHEGDALEDYFQKKNKSYGRYDGTVPYAVKKESIKSFINFRSQYLIAHPGSMGHGTDGLQGVCWYMVHYSISHSANNDNQSNGRAYRKGQEKPCTVYYLIAKSSIDQIIYNAIRRKQKVSTAVLRYIQGNLKPVSDIKFMQNDAIQTAIDIFSF